MCAKWLEKALIFAETFFVFLSMPVSGAEFRVSTDGFNRIYLVGEIVPGDYDRFGDLLRRINPRTMGSAIDLRSGGGNVLEAIKIGRLIRSLYLHTEVPWSALASNTCQQDGSDIGMQVPCICASACFLIWVGGVQRGGTELYIHRIKYDEIFYGSLSAVQAERQYQAGLKMVQDYLSEMGVPDEYYRKMMFVDWGRVVRLTTREAEFLIPPQPAFDEWLRARCGAPTAASAQCYGRAMTEARVEAFVRILGVR